MKPLEPDSKFHGTPNGYFNYRCRCLPCKKAARDYQIEYKKRDYRVYKISEPDPPKQKPATPPKPKKISLGARTNGEANIVDAEPLGSYLRAWVKRWLAERPHNIHGAYGQQKPGYFMGPMDWLAEQTEINIRRVSGICNGEFPRVPLSQADLLLTAIGESWRLSPEIGDIEVKPNPQWSMEQWHAYMRDRGCY